MNLLILGAGQYGYVTKEIAEAMNIYEKISFLDDNNPEAIGRLLDYQMFQGKYDAAIVAIGNYELRMSLIEKLEQVGFSIATLIHPKSYISPSVELGKGCIVEAMAGINTDVVIGNGCLLALGCLINHNSVVESGCHIDCGAIVSARSVVKAGTKVCSGTVFKE